jgi:hypothetical protein
MHELLKLSHPEISLTIEPDDFSVCRKLYDAGHSWNEVTPLALVLRKILQRKVYWDYFEGSYHFDIRLIIGGEYIKYNVIDGDRAALRTTLTRIPQTFDDNSPLSLKLRMF